MKQTIITISGAQIIVTAEANRLLTGYMRKVYLLTFFRPAERTELLATLRDVLLEAGRQPISKVAACSSIGILGSPNLLPDRVQSQQVYRSAKKITHKAFRQIQPARVLMIRKALFLTLASLCAVAFGLTIASYQTQYSVNESGSTLVTNIGTVVLGRLPDHKGGSGVWALAADLAVLAGLFMVSLALSKPNKRTKYYVGVLVALFAFLFYRPPVTSTGPNVQTSLYSGYPDKLLACGDRINTVIIENANTLFYNLYDQGFRLQKELANDPALGVPSRAAICDSYNALRIEYSAEDIILLSFVKNGQGQPIPFDYERYYSPQYRGVGVPDILYGYFIRQT